MSSPTRTNWSLVAALFVTGLFAAAQFGKLTLTILPMQTQYADASAFVSSLVSVVGLVGLVFGIVAGRILVQVGLSRALVVAAIIGAATSLFQSFLPPFGWFAVSRLIESGPHLVLVVACPTLMAQVSTDRDRPVVMGLWASFFGCSFAILGSVLDPIMKAGGLSLLFQLHAVGLAICAAALFVLLPKDARQSQVKPNLVQAYKTLYSTPQLLIPGAGFVWYTFLYIALIAVLPIGLDISVSQVAVLPLISIAGTIVAGFIAKFIAPHRISMASFIGTAVLIMCVVAVDHAQWILWILFFVIGLAPAGTFAAIPFFNTSLMDRATATGGVAHFGNIGTIFGTPIMVLVLQYFGMIGVAGVCALCCLGGVVTLWQINRVIPKQG